jgi:hypothetical protein
MTHHYFTLDALLGFVVWSMCGWVFCYVLLMYYEDKRLVTSGDEEEQKRVIRRTMARCSLVWGLIIGFIWFMQHSNS